MTLYELSQLAEQNENIAASLKKIGLQPRQLRLKAELSQNPSLDKASLANLLGVSKSGRLVVPPDVMIVDPEFNAPDALPPGKRAPGGPPAERTVWRQGLKFSALLAERKNGVYSGFCSANLLDGKWAITAAHCLMSAAGEKLKAKDVALFLPLQGGA